ncbi:USP3 [Bugula neritina]|uniref:ubiquitinyl hydrolase 1 n=1 Tax=Bugula neritina TaxID=10212 RepID=A0A7J7K4U0_BUGNE|nr:USP3 [Bugula neritina]
MPYYNHSTIYQSFPNTYRSYPPLTKCRLLVEEFRKTLVELRRSKTALSPASLFAVIWKVVPNFRGYQQQDAHEFMRYLLDRLHQELLTLLPAGSFTLPRNSLTGVKNSVVTAIFGGVLQIVKPKPTSNTRRRYYPTSYTLYYSRLSTEFHRHRGARRL